MKKEKIIKKIFEKENLSIEESEFIFRNILTGQVEELEISNILLALKLKGETPSEIAGLIKVLDEFKVRFPKTVNYCVDTCGTGGDNKNCFNISTATAVVVSAGEIPVTKHGNSAQSGLIGSADILELLNIPIKLSIADGKKFLKDKKFVFLYAPQYHPSLKYVGSVRKKLGIRTIFNFVGPLINPAEPDFQIIGVGDRKVLNILIETSKRLKKKNLIFYSSMDGYDEISSFAPTECFYVNGEVKRILIKPEEFFTPFKMPVVKNKVEALELFKKAISGDDENLAKLLSLNASLIFYHSKKLNSIKEGYEYAYEIIKNKKAAEKLEELRSE